MKTNTFIKVPSIETSLKPSQLDFSDYSMVEKFSTIESSACESMLIPENSIIFYMNHYKLNLIQLTDHLSHNVRTLGSEKVAYLISAQLMTVSKLINALVILNPDTICIDKELEDLYQIYDSCIHFDNIHSKDRGYQSITVYINHYISTQDLCNLIRVSKFNVEEMLIVGREEMPRTIRVINLA